ncbi:ThiF family adenylyltransferase [Echinicola soli]|uniref:ThiF family adenylyltransferase n=1 Tax=Echinicola soli TaxID=2591634 RepID=A0A514CG40_9BACT|nr:ThiF family adenylyltransferase [Echinicola soli]QDH78730.1 ThiF family adenylyltransferase [Echinicola soli]
MRMLKLYEKHYDALKHHLFPGDGLESIAFVLCGNTFSGNRKVFTSHKVKCIPHEKCNLRAEDRIDWDVSLIQDLIEEAEVKGLSLFKIHSHPGGYNDFSEVDNISDNSFFPTLNAEIDQGIEHGSIVMTPDGMLVGRIVIGSTDYQRIDVFQVVGNVIHIQSDNGVCVDLREEYLRNSQAFGRGTQSLLQKMKVAVIGCSGTGSPTIEQLYRLGVGELVIVDFDTIERKNLNRILHSKVELIGTNKAYAIKEALDSTGLPTKITIHTVDITESELVISDLSTCDLVFGCTDSVLSRDLLTAISSFYLIPYIDMGVKLSADGQGGIKSIYGVINYISPGDSLLERGQYTQEDLRAEGLFKDDPDEYKGQLDKGYISNVNVESPAVISVNVNISSFAVLDMLERIHPYRDDGPERVKRVFVSLSDLDITINSKFDSDKYLMDNRGRGNVYPLLYMPNLSRCEEAT